MAEPSSQMKTNILSLKVVFNESETCCASFFVSTVFLHKLYIEWHLMEEDNDSAIRVTISLFGILLSAVSAVKE